MTKKMDDFLQNTPLKNLTAKPPELLEFMINLMAFSMKAYRFIKKLDKTEEFQLTLSKGQEAKIFKVFKEKIRGD